MPAVMPFLLLLAGALSATGFAPLGWWPLTLGAFAALAWAVERAPTRRQAALLGYAFAVGHFALGLNWIAGAFRYQEAMPVWLGWIAVVLLSLYLAVYPAMAALAAWGFRQRPAAYVLAWGAAWIVTEWLRATLFTGFAWNPLAAIAAGSPFAGVLPIVGTYGLSGLIVLGCAALVPFGRHLRHEIASKPLTPARIAAIIAFFVLPELVAVMVLPSLFAQKAAVANGPLLRVVQPNIGQQDKQDESFDETNFQKLAALSGVPGAEPRLILWPEAAVPWYLEHQRLARTRIAALLGPRDIVLLGGTSLIFDHRGEVVAARNALFAMQPGKVFGRYSKSHLVPYGEYLPARPVLSLIGLSRLVPGDLDFWAGPGPLNISVPGIGPVGAQICYEIIFSGQVVDPRQRPRFLFNPSNDAWFGDWGPPQHLAQAQLRAAEEGLPVVRSTPTGISAIIDANGSIVAALPLGKAGFLQSRLPAAQPATPFARAGNTLPLLLAALLAFGAVALARRRRYGT